MIDTTADSRRPFAWDDFESGEPIPPSTVTITDEMVSRFVRALDLDHPWFSGPSPFGGPIVPPTLLANYLGQKIFSNLFNSPRGTGLHARQTMEFLKPQRIGETLHVDGVISGKYEKRGKQYMSIDAEIRDQDGEPVLRGTYLRMCSFVPGVAREKREDAGAVEPVPGGGGGGGTCREDWWAGDEIAPVGKLMTAAKIALYSGGGKNFHNDEAVARSYGLSRPAGMALMSNAYIAEMLMRFFGERWFTGGRLSLAFIATTHAGDLFLSRGLIRERNASPDGETWDLDVWLERNGQKVAVGTASCTV